MGLSNAVKGILMPWRRALLILRNINSFDMSFDPSFHLGLMRGLRDLLSDFQ